MYQAPRTDADRVAATIFSTSIESLPSILALKSEKKSEGNTKGFAAHHKLGLPVAVTFFYIKNENEEHQCSMFTLGLLTKGADLTEGANLKNAYDSVHTPAFSVHTRSLDRGRRF